MAIQLRQLKRCRIYEEPAGAWNGGVSGFGADHSATPGDYLDAPIVTDPALQYGRGLPMLEPGMAHQVVDGYNVQELGPKFGTLPIVVPFATFTSRVANDAVAPQSALGRVLKIMMTGEHLGTGQTVSGGTAAAPEVDSATGIRVGGAIATASGAGGRLEAREVKSISGTTINLKHARSSASGATAHAAATYFLYGNGYDGSLQTHLQAMVQGMLSHERFLFRGGYPSGTLELGDLAPGNIARVSTQWRFADYMTDAEAAGDLSGALAVATYLNNVPLVIKDSEFRYQANGTTTIGNLIKAPSIQWQPNWVYETHMSPGGLNTINQAIRVPTDDSALTVAFTVPYEDEAWRTLEEARTAIGLFYQIGSSPTRGGILLSAPTCQVVDMAEAGAGNISAVQITCKARPDEDTDLTGLTGAELAQANSAARIHLY